jgi:plastocyanin
MLRKYLLGMALIAGLMAPMQSQAASTIVVEMGDSAFFPFRVQAAAGDTIRFVNKGPAHSIASYSGQEFDSGPQPIATYGTFEIVFDGTPTAYRETGRRPSNQSPYSTLDGNGNCDGMCGWISTTPPSNPPGTPVIVSPVDGSTVETNAVTVQGTVANANRVRITYAAQNKVVDAIASGPDGNFAWTWQYTNGPVLLTLRAWNNAEGWAGPSTSLAFEVAGGDVALPTIKLDAAGRVGITGAPFPTRVGQIELGTGPIEVSAIVTDDVSVKTVSATLVNLATNGESDVILDCTNNAGESFIGGCSSTSGKFVRAVSKVFATPGYYKLTVTATDAAGNTSTKSTEVIILSPI